MLGMLRVVAEWFGAAFGDPAATIARGALNGDAGKRVLCILHDMECVVRRLLLLRAALFPPPPLRAIRPSKTRLARARETLAAPLQISFGEEWRRARVLCRALGAK